ncbi:MAG TPA: hypothetical protein VHF25_02000 [Nitriliruptorales bacterium]|nr:hypothetical protein [Nitriliruptorales bacterium]
MAEHAERRSRTLELELTPREWEAWDACRRAAGHGDLAGWVRETVGAAVGGATAAPGASGVVVPELNQAAHRELVRLSNDVSQLLRYLHTTGELSAQLERTLAEVRRAAAAVIGEAGRAGGT